MKELDLRATLAAMLVLIVGCAGPGGSNGPIEARSSQDGVEMIVAADRSVARIAEPVTVRVEVNADESVNLSIPEPVAAENDFVTVEAGDARSETADGRQTQARTFRFESYTSGRRAIPAFVVKYADAGKSSNNKNGRTLRSDSIPVRVVSSVGLFADPRKFRDNVDVIDPPHGWLFWTILAGLAIASVTALVTALKSLVRGFALPGTPGEIAVRELNGVERRALLERWSPDRTIAAVDVILRTFLQQSWRLPDAQPTTEELTWAAEAQADLAHGQRATIQWLLHTADRMKFAQSELTSLEAVRSIFATRALIVGMIRPTNSPRRTTLPEAASHV